MPQPLKKLTELNGGPESVLQRPHLAAMIAAIAAHATRIEDTFARLFVWLLKREDEVALSIYLDFIARDNRLTALKAVARDRLSPTDQDKLNRLAEKSRARLKERNDLIHGWWATSDDHPDSLLLIDQKRYHASHFRYLHEDFKDESERLSYLDDFLKYNTVHIYNENDFRAILDRLFQFYSDLETFIRYVQVIR